MDQTLTHPSAAAHAHLHHVIEHAAHLLPAQGPINVFVHHNTLHAFEELTFTEAVAKAAKTFGCHPYRAEEEYRELFAAGKIRREDLEAVLTDDLGERADELLGFMGTRFGLRMDMIEHPLRLAPSAELRWLIAETDALRRFRSEVPRPTAEAVIRETRHWVLRDLRNGRGGEPGTRDRAVRDAVHSLIRLFGEDSIEHWTDDVWEAFVLNLLWRVCQHGVHGLPRFTEPPPSLVRHRDWLHEATGEDSDRLVNEVLIRFCATFLDQGLANWGLPNRDHGFFRAFGELYSQRFGPPDRWLLGLPAELERIQREGMSALESVAESLMLLGVTRGDEEAFISSTLLALRGWAGMIHQVEIRGDRVAHPAPPGSLIEFLAVRLILERLALTHLARRSLDFTGPLHELRKVARSHIAKHDTVSVEQRAYLVFQLSQVRGWKPEQLYRLTKPEWSQLVREMESFSGLERRRVFQLALERRYRHQMLDGVANHTKRYWLPTQATATDPIPRPSFQIITCIDDREESFKRYLEELEPTCETFGAAGFFCVPMYFQSVTDAYSAPLCPIIMKPQHYVREEVPYSLLEEHRRRAARRRLLGAQSHLFHRSSRTFLGGALAAVVGPLASIPLVMRVLFPRLTARIRRAFGRLVQPPLVNQLTLERTAPQPGPEPGALGFTVEEMTNAVERLLRDIGLTSHFARLIIVTGHGSSSLNNPHESAYNCGACGGGRGGPNARAVAWMANEPRVREQLARRGLEIPTDTVFVGAYHNTCDDSVQFFGLDHLPSTHVADFDRVKKIIDEARMKNAHERCRRFASAELTLTPEQALRHVEARAEDLSQTRPEYNHATNAMCVVGRRSRSRGLFLDRRSFLTSYDPRQDDAEKSILARILGAVVPVCAGINLEYYFSTVDVPGYGCGTKLPHNVTSLIGVMDGAASDLRTGLSAQMTEIHEAIRLLFLIETTPAAMRSIMDRNPVIGRLCGHGWVQVATLDPDSAEIHVLQPDGTFSRYRPETDTLKEVASSVDWYRGWRDHLPPVHVTKGLAPNRTPR